MRILPERNIMKKQFLSLTLITALSCTVTMANEIRQQGTMLQTCNLIVDRKFAKHISDSNQNYTFPFNSEYSDGAQRKIEEERKIIPEAYEYRVRTLRFSHISDLLENGYLKYNSEIDANIINSSLVLRNPYEISLLDVQDQIIPQTSYDNTQTLKAAYYINFEKPIQKEDGSTRYNFEPVYKQLFYITPEFTFQNLAQQYLKSVSKKKDTFSMMFSHEMKFMVSGESLDKFLKKHKDLDSARLKYNLDFVKIELVDHFLRTSQLNDSDFLIRYGSALPHCKNH